MQAADAPLCKARDILKARLRADLKVYADAVSVLQRNIGEDFEKFHKRVERARRAYEVAREKLYKHTTSHGCE